MFKSNESDQQSLSEDRLLQELQNKMLSLQKDNAFLKERLIQANQRISKCFKQRAQGEETCDQKLRVQIHRLYIALDESKQKLKNLQSKFNIIRLQLDKTQALAKKLHSQLQLRTQSSLSHEQCVRKERQLRKRIQVLEGRLEDQRNERLQRNQRSQRYQRNERNQRREREIVREKARLSSVSPRQRPRERKSVQYSEEYLSKLSKEMKKNMQLSKSIDNYKEKNQMLSDQVKILKKIVKSRQDHTLLIKQLKDQLYRNHF